ncbi:hypothetical protein Bhyg_14196 [Pseudolycoriella hygida]|uniref:Uncharacterized protein n=1 Tax=Pseudolycoriella hygida TaxID=35572 RepID=A0A9Q0MR33_9DIPT|nr:hypothetical protein Bhyg_14196 [Pseudolycoriella hygida]
MVDQVTSRRQLFLQRNIRRFKSHQIVKSNSQMETEQTYVVEEDTRLKIATESTSKTVVNATNSGETSSNDVTVGGIGSARIINDPFWGKRPPERIGSAPNDGYFVEDKAEVKLNMNTYKMVFVMNKDVLFYKKYSLRRAKEGVFLTHININKKNTEINLKYKRNYSININEKQIRIKYES